MPVLATARTKVKSGLAVSSFFAAFIGGCLAAVSSIGGPFRTLANAGPTSWWWAPWAWFIVFFVICLGDWAEDAIPNRRAVFTAAVWPSFLVAALTGESGRKLFDAVNAISARLGAKNLGTTWAKHVNDWLHPAGPLTAAYTVFSLLGIGMGVVWAQQYAKKKKKAAVASATAPALPVRTGTSR